MTSQHRIELALRAANLMKDAAGLMDCQNTFTIRLTCDYLQDKLEEVRKFAAKLDDDKKDKP